MSCSQPAFVNVFGQLRQEHAGISLGGYFSAFVLCDGTAPWGASVYVFPTAPFNGRAAALLVAGPATVTATMFAFDPETAEFVQRNLVADVILRGSR